MIYNYLTLVIPILIIIAIIYFIVRPHRDHNNARNPYRALMGYFYLVTAASVITMTVGMIFLIRVAISQAYNGGEIKNNLTLAAVLLGVGLAICVLHIYGRRTVQKNDEETTTDIRRIFLFSMLGVFSLAGLIMLPLAIYQFIHYYIVEGGNNFPFQPPTPPSTELAIAIVIVPLWAYYMFRVLREIRQVDSGKVEG